jgi:Peptidase family M48
MLVMLAVDLSLPQARLEVAARVVGSSGLYCTSHFPDGTNRPCMPRFAVRPGNWVNAKQKAGTIEFTVGAINRLTDDEFALLVGHELAHWYLGHKASTSTNELAADRLGATLVCHAGFNPHAGVTLFRFLSAGTTHPGRGLRQSVVLQVDCPAPNNAASLPA